MAIAFVQQANNINAVAGTSLAVTTTALTTGNWLIVAASSTTGTSWPMPGKVTVGSGTINGMWTPGTAAGAINATPLYLFVGRITSGGATSVTFTTPSGAIAVIVTEFSATNPLYLDVTNSANGTVTSVSSGSVATTGTANELWVGATTFRNDTISTQQINAASPDNSFSAITTAFTTTANRGVGLAYKIASSTGTPAYTATLNQTTVWSAAIICLREIFLSGPPSYSRSDVVNRTF